MDFTALVEAGVDVESAIERCLGNEELYAKLLTKFLDEPNYRKLLDAVSENNKADALAASHTLKGVCGNLSQTVLYELFSKQVSLIRGGEWEKAVAMMPEITKSYEEMTCAVSEWLKTI